MVPTSTATPTQAPSTPEASPTAAATTTPTATATAALPVGEGMVRAPAGDYTVGGPAADANHIAETTVKLGSFWIDTYPVTYAQYADFLSKTGRAAPAAWPDGRYPAGRDRYPATDVTWDDAAAYCAWSGKRLPSEAEWEAAGRGPGAAPPLYPWGADPTAGGMTDSIPARDGYAVGTLDFNVSPLGVFDMIGSVWQWVGEPYAPVPDGAKVLRGGRHRLASGPGLPAAGPAGRCAVRALRRCTLRCGPRGRRVDMPSRDGFDEGFRSGSGARGGAIAGWAFVILAAAVLLLSGCAAYAPLPTVKRFGPAYAGGRDDRRHDHCDDGRPDRSRRHR